MITRRGDVTFEKAIKRFEDHVINEVKRVVAETTEIIVAGAKVLAPVGDIDGGNLRGSIEAEYYNDGLSAMITVGAHYAIYVNYGTGIYAEGGDGRKTPWTYYSEALGRFVTTEGMPAQQFWEPALESGRDHYEREMKKIGV